VDTQQIVQGIAYMSWALLGAMALGLVALCWLLRRVTDATKGFLGFSVVLGSVLGLLWFSTDTSLPDPAQLWITAAPELDGTRSVTIGAFTALALVSGIRLLRGGGALWLSSGAIVAGCVAMALGAAGWAGGALLGVPFLVQLLALSVVTGGSLGGVILAHWYLVTPRISEQPLILTTRLLVAALVVQLLLFAAWVSVGVPAGPPLSAFTGPHAFFAWLRLFVGLLFPLVLAYLAYRTALTRSMESATGLLYIQLAVVLASTIVSAALAFSVGLLL
jgi:hypothetical protein